MLFYIYSNAPGTTIDITSRCRVGRFSVKDQAEEGAVALSSLIIDDPAGDLQITGHRRIYIYESEAPILDQVVFNGFVVNERVSRGPYRTGVGRIWTVDLADPNVFLNRRIMNGADANRPAENDLQRIQALLTMTELNTVDDDTYVNVAAATTAMDAVDYRGQNVGAYIDDCRQASGKNAYILYNETVGQYGLWYDFTSGAVYDSGKRLSNVLADIDQSTVFEYSQDRTYLNRDPTRVASGIYLDYADGSVYVQDATITAAFAAIDWAAPSVNVKSLAKATARANRYLADAATEDEIIHTVMTSVPRAKVNNVKKGQIVKFKAAHLPGYETYRNMRPLYRAVTEVSEDPQASYEIEMDLSPMPLGGFVIDGQNGQIATSPDGITWTLRTGASLPHNPFSATSGLNAAWYGNGQWVGVADDGKLGTSPDAITWTLRTSSFGASDILDVSYGNGLWVAVGQSGKLASSPDGITWTQRTTPWSGTGADLVAVVYGNAMWVCIMDDGTGGVASSPDGITWTQRTMPFGTAAHEVSFGNDIFVMVGGVGAARIGTSTDGITWTNRANGALYPFKSVAYGNGLWVVGGEIHEIWTSPDAITWTERTSPTLNPACFWLGVVYNGLWVIVSSVVDLATSPDGITWTLRNPSFGSQPIHDVATNDGFVIP